jgi:hypothetical protein
VGGTMIQGRMPIIATSAEQISTDPLSIQEIIWNPSAVSQGFVLSDNNNNVIYSYTMAATSPIQPVVIQFLFPIPTQGLVVKSISSGSTLFIYPAAI